MALPRKKQHIQDWITQQWVIFFGKKIDQKDCEWLLGPFGNTNGIGEKYISELAENEQLIVDRIQKDKGLIQSINQLGLSESELNKLSDKVVDFYENTSDYNFDLTVKWNPIFRVFGFMLKLLFSNRIQQLNIPTKNIRNSNNLKSEIIHLICKETGEVKRTIWLRTFSDTGQVVYSGVYDTCVLPSTQSCIKAVFPLPNGNATVILSPSVGPCGELILSSSGKKIGDSGFYFLLYDSKGQLWTKFIKTFTDKLIVCNNNVGISAIQSLRLWKLEVVRFDYKIYKR